MRSLFIRCFILMGLLFPALASMVKRYSFAKLCDMNKLISATYHNTLIALALFAQVGLSMPAHATDLSIATGWSLLGYSGGTSVKIETVFGTNAANNLPNVTSNIVSVWKWANSGWQFWTPAMTTTDLAAYASSKGYQVLSDLQPGDGYWINAKVPVTLNDFASAPTKIGSFDVLRKVDINCHGYTFNPNSGDLTIAMSGNQLTLTEDDFFDKRCIYTAASITSPLTGTFRCANNAFDEGTFVLTGDRQHEANDIRLVMDVATANRACNYKIRFIGFRK